jgi:hypothetical protein
MDTRSTKKASISPTAHRVANDVRPSRAKGERTLGGPAPIRSRIAESLRELADAIEAEPLGLNAGIVDQYQSPLGRRRHLKLVREGKLKGYKPDRVHVFVELSDIVAFVRRHPVGRTVAPAKAPGDTEDRDPRRLARQLRAELGLVPVRKRA